MNLMQKKHIFFIALLLYILLISLLLFCSFNNTEIRLPRTFLNIPIDKIAHFLMFAPFPFLCWANLKFTSLKNRANVIISLFFSIFLAASTEIAQMAFTNNRVGDINDFYADLTGITIGLIFTLLFGNAILKLVNRSKKIKNE